MKRLTVVLALVACGGSSNHHGSDASIDSHAIDSHSIDAPPDARPIDAPADSSIVIIDAPVLDAPPAVCNPLTQAGCATGEKCTWLVDEYTPQYIGHIGCAPNGTAAVDASCQFGAAGASGYDNCLVGEVCSNYQGGPGVCRSICDNQGGNPMCDASHGCVVKSNLFSTGGIAAAGVCDPSCDPLADNDFDGPGSALTRTGSACGSAMIGCYGYPSGGTAPATTFTCQSDLNYATPLHHRTVCDMTNGCQDSSGSFFVNSCNQGYLPLLYESTGTTAVVCVAMCKPENCYAGSCGTSNVNQHGASPHRCENPDALGTFDTTATGEECAYWWYLETDSTSALLKSPYSDSLGFCFDHSKYQYDSNNDGVPDTALPSCQQLQVTATGTDPTMPLTYFGAKDLGCVDSATAGLFTGKQPKPALTGLRGPYHRAMR